MGIQSRPYNYGIDRQKPTGEDYGAETNRDKSGEKSVKVMSLLDSFRIIV